MQPEQESERETLGTRGTRDAGKEGGEEGFEGAVVSGVDEVGGRQEVEVGMELLRSDQLGECQDALLPGRDARAPQPSCRCTDEMAVQGMIDAGDWRTEA